MKNIVLIPRAAFYFFSVAFSLSTNSVAQDGHDHMTGDEEVFEFSVGEFDPITGENANVGGFLFPALYANFVGGVFEPGTEPSDLGITEHDPQREAGIQALELAIPINFNDVVTGNVTGVGIQGEDEWEAAVEEAYLHFHVNDYIAIGGGQFLNSFGFQGDKHLHDWDFINQNLPNGRLLNEGELITQGGELLVKIPDWDTLATVGIGGVRTHAHDHGHGHGHGDEEEEHGDEEHDHDDEDHDHDEEDHDEEHHDEDDHLEIDDANFVDFVATLDLKTKMPFDDTLTLSASVAQGQNGFGRNTTAYGVGAQKIWGAHDHGHGPEFCAGAVMIRSEYIGRHIGVEDALGRRFDADDHGLSSSIHYGLSEAATISLRHDWISDLDEFGVEDRHRISPALTVYLGQSQRVRARLQYDCNHFSYGTEHAAWLQFQVQWGGQGGRHHH